MTDLISREKAIHELRNVLYKYEDENEEKYIKDNNTDEWFLHIRPAVQNLNDIGVQTIEEMPSESPWHTGTPTEEGWYLVEAKDWEKQRVYYVPDYVSVHDLVLPTVQSFYETHLWQKIELSDEAKDLEKKKK